MPDPVVCRALWEEIHLWAQSPTVDLANAPRWLDRWMSRVPCGECRSNARLWIQRNPPDLSSAVALFAWTVRFHSAISAKIGKPQWTVEQAVEYWGKFKPQETNVIKPKEESPPLPTGPEQYFYVWSGGSSMTTAGVTVSTNLAIGRFRADNDGKNPKVTVPAKQEKVTPEMQVELDVLVQKWVDEGKLT